MQQQEKKISAGFYEDDEDEDNEKKKKKKEEEDASSTLKSESESYFLGFEIPANQFLSESFVGKLAVCGYFRFRRDIAPSGIGRDFRTGE